MDIRKRDIIRDIISSVPRVFIFGIIGNPENKNPTITQIHEGLCHQLKQEPKKNRKGLNYKNTYKHLKILEKRGYIKLKQDKNIRGKPVHVSLVNKEDFKIFLDIFDKTLK